MNRFLPKKTGSGFSDIKTHCLNNELIGKETIKSAQETGMGTDEFVHVIKSKLKNYEKNVVVKIHDSNSIYIAKELFAIEELSTFKNAVKSICNFSCIDNRSRWESNIRKDTKFCNNERDKLHFFIYEYIENGDVEEYFNSNPSVMEIKNIFLQCSLVIMILVKKYNIIHGDLNSGNILFSKTSQKTISYTLGDKKYIINTNGRIPMLIDFGRCKKIKGNINENAMDDVFILLDTLSIWIKNTELKEKVRKFLLDESIKKENNMNLFITAIHSFFTTMHI
jgi:serine/threonine protein kinase